ncbi:hypothetical protein BAE44_0021692 [Dichanthelium oligosanthes]|uniref:Nuclease HARBI1 n=1 Tax=Dichanthelium oligosanthes TaxID=888268 RepID=A0A1E5UWZ5_9POAL|nr:hypothetical protein BAE44_0021692 [Dichanthelium oligosanthes]
MGRQIVRRNILEGHDKLFADYFSDNPVYNDDTFRRRFRMTKGLFLRIMYVVTDHDVYFTQWPNAANQLRCNPLQKVTAALRMLATACSADSLDSDLRMTKSTIIESLLHFVRSVLDIFRPYYLRRPNDDDISRLLAKAEERGFFGMLGSIDCMHWI